jgi:predicted nucleotidyltransferase
MDEIIRRVADWASQEPLIVSVRGFGSRFGGRFRGLPRPNSDVDLALVIDPGQEEYDVCWIENAQCWRRQLHALLGLETKIHPSHREPIRTYLMTCSRLIYERR